MEDKETKYQLRMALQTAILADWKLTQFRYSAADGLLNFTWRSRRTTRGSSARSRQAASSTISISGRTSASAGDW